MHLYQPAKYIYVFIVVFCMQERNKETEGLDMTKRIVQAQNLKIIKTFFVFWCKEKLLYIELQYRLLKNVKSCQRQYNVVQERLKLFYKF